MPTPIFSTKKTHFRLQVWIAAVVFILGSAAIIEASTLTVTKTADTNDGITPGLVLGSVSAVGSVSLRSVPVGQEGTLFGGDTVRVYANAYAKIGFVEGQKVELGEWTQLTPPSRFASRIASLTSPKSWPFKAMSRPRC